MPNFDVSEIDEDAVLKEVWNINDIEAKTELTSNQITNMSKLLTLAHLIDSSVLFEHCAKFMVLQKSKDRKSMDEFVRVVKARREDSIEQGKNFFKGMMG